MPGPISWAARRPTAAAALIYLVLSVAMFVPAFAPGRTLSASDYLWTATPWDLHRAEHANYLGSNREQTDSVFMFQPFLQHTRAALPDIPLWNPSIMGGRPFQANSQAAVLSPFSLPAYVLPFWDSLPLIAALKLFVAALGTFLLARAFRMRFAAALLAGVVFGLSFWCVTWVSWTTMSVWAFLPWLCLLAELCARRPGPLPLAGLAGVVGLQFLGGHPSSSFQILVAVALFWGVRAIALRDGQVVRRLLTLGGAFALGSALAAITLIPFLELLRHSIDLKERSAASSDAHEPARYLVTIFLHDWWGRSTRQSLEFAEALEEHAYYVGALPLMLAASAVALTPRRERIVVAAVGLVSLAVAVGIPPFFTLVKVLPGFDAARNGRLAVVAVLCAAVLAGWGLDDLTRAPVDPRRRRLVLAACGVLFLVPFVYAIGRVHLGALGDAARIAWGFADPAQGQADAVRLGTLLEWLVLGVAALALLLLRLRGRVGASAFTLLALGLVVLDLFKAGMGYNPAIRERDAVQPATPAIRYLQRQRPARFAGVRPTDPFTLAVPIPPNVAMRYHLYDARGYDFPFEERYSLLWRDVIAPSPCNYAFCPEAAGTSPRALQALGLLGVTDLLQSRRDAPLPDLERVYSGSDAKIYRNPRALPRAFLVDRQLVAPSATAARDTVTAPSFPACSVAVTESRLPGLAEGRAGPASAGGARIEAYGDERVVARTDARRPALLVLTDSWFPGWKASVDGRDVPIHRVDYLIRGVAVPAGAHRVEFRYQPASWRAGWIVSLVAALVLVGTLVVGLRRRRAGAT
jgi:Bacterial membrane protein YfhO